MTAFTEQVLREMLATAEKATPGPWSSDDDEGYSIWRVRGAKRLIAEVVGDDAPTEANAYHIANMDPDTAARLLRCALAARSMINSAKRTSYCPWCDIHSSAEHWPDCEIGALARELEGR